MEATHEEIATVTASRVCAYAVMQRLFRREPDAEALDALMEDSSRIAFSLIAGEDNEKLRPFEEALEELGRSRNEDPQGTLRRLEDEYTRLMLGPAALPAPPWESVYAANERVIFQPVTLEVRREYVRHGLVPSGHPRVADDHLSLELDFMRHLAGRIHAAAAAGETDAALEDLEASRDFLSSHLLKWAGRFAKEIQASKTHLLYPQAALALAEFLRCDQSCLDSLTRALRSI